MRSAIVAIWAALLILVTGCAGRGSGTSVTGDGSTTPDLAALAPVDAIMAQHSAQGNAYAVGKVAEALATSPGFSEVEHDGEGTAWGRLPSGRIFVINFSRVLTTVPPLAPTGRTRAPGSGVIPGSKRAAVFTSFANSSSGHTDYAEEVAATVKTWGYDVLGGGASLGTVEDYMGAGELGLLYTDTHSGSIKVGGVGQLAVMTGSPVLPGETKFATLLDAEELGVMRHGVIGVDGKTAYATNYAILPKFVETRMKFAPESIVWANSCYSKFGSPAFLKAGAGVYLGWSRVVTDTGANLAARRFFQTMTGFLGDTKNWEEAKADLASENLLADRETQAVLEFFPGTAPASHLVPEIENIVVNGLANQWEINGAFGRTPGDILAVDAGNAKMTVLSWTPTLVIVQIMSGVQQIRADIDGRMSRIYDLREYTLMGPNGGPFITVGRTTVTIHPSVGSDYRVVYQDPVGSGGGAKGPIRFLADFRLASDQVLAIEVEGALGQVGAGPMFLRVPSGRIYELEVQLVQGVWTSNSVGWRLLQFPY